ncbi:MAG TPA: aminodeoxychorismate/anthranilate synthase component II [Chitinophagales bacterium]|nr:aminodeoxychorismate/anthranilate synthase component II [Chitinophagales bacterium]
MVLLLDNYDSFTYNLYDYILQLGLTCKVVRNNELSIDEIATLNFSCAVISPGPKTPDEAGITMPFIERFNQVKPILGICLGHQAIGQFFGAKVVRAQKPMHGKTSLVKHTGHALFKNVPQDFEAMRYHSLIINNIEKTPLQVIAKTETEVMAVAHPQLKIAGIQFHPESVLTPDGLQIMHNWFEWAGISQTTPPSVAARG